MSLRSVRSRRLNYGSLEDRRLLAGNIRVVENVHLFIRGDAADNQFELVVDGDQLQINGLEGTTVNGKDSYVVEGATVTESGVTFEGGLRAHLGPGHDDFAITDAQFESLSIVYGGTGNDNIDLVDSVFSDKATFQTYEGDDSISVSESQFDDTFRAITLAGEDAVSLIDSRLNGDSIVATGHDSDSIHSQGNHYLGGVNLILPLDGNDTVQLTNPVVGEHQLGVFLGDGDDTINADLSAATVDGTISIGGQGGIDVSPEILIHEDVVSSVNVSTIEDLQVFDGGVGGAENIDTAFPSFFDEATNTSQRFATPVLLNATETITTVEWTGAYNLEINGGPLSERNDRFVVEIFEGAEDGAPDSSTSVRFEAGEANRSDSGVTGNGTFGDEYAIFDYSADIEFTAEAGKVYWISIYTLTDASENGGADTWAWGVGRDFSLFETVESASQNGFDDDWRIQVRNEQVPFIRDFANLDIRLRNSSAP